MNRSQPIILASMAVTVTSAIVSHYAGYNKKSSPLKILVGGYLTTMFLLIGSEVNEQVAEGFALLIATASLVGPNGTAFTNFITSITTTKAPPKAQTYNPVIRY